jgi:hypothetical protein
MINGQLDALGNGKRRRVTSCLLQEAL